MKKIQRILTGVALVATLATGLTLGNGTQSNASAVYDSSNSGSVTVQYDPGTST